jgi:hypothetical protein
LTVLIPVAVSAALSAVIALRIPRQLMVSTDIVGYPIFGAYKADRLESMYWIGVLLFPLTALVLYLCLAWIVTRWWGPSPPTLALPLAGEGTEPVPDLPWARAGKSLARVLAVGSVFGLGATIALGAVGGAFWLTIAAVALAYGGVAAGASFLYIRVAGAHRGLPATMSRLNVLAAPLTLAGVVAASASSRVTIASDGSVHRYSGLPSWAVIALTAAVLGWAIYRLSRDNTQPAIRELERRALLFVALPVSLFLLVSGLPGALPPMDMFHDGESLAAARLTSAGYFPWRDLMSIHGFFQDCLTPLVGIHLLENTRWGVEAGRALILYPLSYVFLVVFIAWLFRRSWVLVLAFVAVILGAELVPITGSRFMFLPLVLLLLAVALERRSRWLGIALGGTLAVQAILVPETAYAVVGCGLIVILHDFYHRRPKARLLDVLSLTAWCVAGGSAVIVGFLLLLLSQRALGDYLLYFSLFAPSHGLSGGLPLDMPPLTIHNLNRQGLELFWKDRSYLFFAFSTPAILLLAFLYYAVTLIRRRPLDTADWVMGAAAIFSLFYYTKFVERADFGHARQVYAEAVPLLAFAVYRAVTYVDVALARWRVGRRSISVLSWQPGAVAVLLIALLGMPGARSIPARVADTPNRFKAVVPAPADIGPMGYAAPGLDLATYSDLGKVLTAYLRPGDWVFDFSNEPGLYYYLLGQDPHTRYYNVSMAIPEAGQKDLIKQLERDQPKLVVFTNLLRLGLPQWDGIPNMVRHYDVSQYLLDNYTPLLSSHTQIIYGLTSANLSATTAANLQLSEAFVTADLAFQGLPCDWGYAPNFLSISPASAPRVKVPITLAAAAAGFAGVTGARFQLEVSPPSSGSWADYRWLEIDSGAGFREDAWSLSDVAGADAAHQITFRTLDRSPHHFRVYVGSCAQWHGYAPTSLLLTHGNVQDIVAVRLLP